MIKTIDNFFPEEIREKIFQLLNRPKWSYNGGNSANRFWHMDGLEKEDYFNTTLFTLICNEIGDYNCKRIYANGQTAGQNGYPHCDDGDVTFLYYPNPAWNVGDQGHLIFLKDDEVTSTVLYKPNRAVVFTADTLHYAEAPHRFFNGLRSSLAYKLLFKHDGRNPSHTTTTNIPRDIKER